MPNNLQLLKAGIEEKHGKIDKHSFFERYSGKLSLVDHYLHLRQLYEIYKALESEEKNIPILEKLPEELKYLLKRSDEIKKDLDSLEKHIPVGQRNVVLKNTLAYVTYLKRQDGPGLQEGKILSHLLVRLLGDLFGGQKLKEKLEQIYNQKIPKGTGLDFYTFKNGTLLKLCSWFNSLKLNMEAFVREANVSFDKHSPRFDELENHVVDLPRPSQCGMFAFKAVAVVALMAIGAGLTVAHSSVFKK